MRIEQLLYLAAIIDTGSFSGAAERLHIAQPSISQSISALEKELGVDLLVRTRAGAVATEVGCAVAEHARRIIGEVDSIEKLAKEHLTPKDRSIKVVAGIAAISTFLASAVDAVESSEKINILEGSTQLAEQLLSRGEIDLAVVPYVEFNSRSGFSFLPLLTSNLVALVRRDSPLAVKDMLTFEDIQAYPVSFGSSEYTSGPHILQRLSAYGTPNIALRTQNISLIKTRILSSGIVGLIFDLSCLNENFSGQPITLRPVVPSLTLTFGILSRENKTLPPLAKQLTRELKHSASLTQKELERKSHV